MPDVVSSMLRFVLKLVLGLMAAVLAVSLLVAALVVLAFSVLKALITGQKPAAPVVFSRFQRFTPQDLWPRKKPPARDVVDVEMREVPNDPDPLPDHSPHAVRRSAQASAVADAQDISDVTSKPTARHADVAP